MSIAAKMKSIIFVGKHSARIRPAPNAAKISPLLVCTERIITPTFGQRGDAPSDSNYNSIICAKSKSVSLLRV